VSGLAAQIPRFCQPLLTGKYWQHLLTRVFQFSKILTLKIWSAAAVTSDRRHGAAKHRCEDREIGNDRDARSG
jgi:hypothetical protein